MSPATLTFKEKAASRDEIHYHLLCCKDYYSPPLDQTVDLVDYAAKLFEKSETFEAWSDGVLVGLVAAYLNDAGGRNGYITNVSVVTAFKGLGVATALVGLCLEKARLGEFEAVMLEVNRANAPAVRLYRKVGFEECETRGESIMMRLCLTSS